MAKYSRSTAAVRRKKTQENNHGGLQPITRTSKGMPMVAVANRRLRSVSTGLHRWRRWFFELFVGPTEPPLAPLVFK